MKYYLSDTENIGNQWSQFIHELSAGDHMIMFHTETNCHQSITLDQLSNMTNFGTIKLYGVPCARGENALDFQLSSYLGFLLATADKETDSFVILSKDKGYEPLISFWKAQGYQVMRKEPEGTESVVSKSNAKPSTNQVRTRQLPGTRTPIDKVRIEYIRLLKEAGVTEGIELDKTTNVMMHTINLPKQGQALQIQNQMRQNFGQKKGMDLYHRVKPVFDQVIKNGPYPPKKEGL